MPVLSRADGGIAQNTGKADAMNKGDNGPAVPFKAGADMRGGRMGGAHRETGKDTVASASQRLVELDFLRGIAVLGILFANIVVFANPMLTSIWPAVAHHPMDLADKAVWLVQVLLVDGRMRGLFSLLFGASLILFVERYGARRQIRRLSWLALFGLAHYFLLFRGDILFPYAFCGMLALGLMHLDAGRLLALGGLAYVAGALAGGAMFWPMVPAEAAFLIACPDIPACLGGATGPVADGYRQALATAQAESAAMQDGFAGLLAYQWANHAAGPLNAAAFALLETLPLMLIGMGLFRAGLFGPYASDQQARRIMIWGCGGIALGFMLSLVLALWVMRAGYPLYLGSFLLFGPAQLAHLPMILGYALVACVLAPRLARMMVGRGLVAAGRMAFSVYLFASLAMAFMFQGWGLGWYGLFSRTELLLCVLAGWVFMLALPVWWLARFRQGPLEWLWRALTHGRGVVAAR